MAYVNVVFNRFKFNLLGGSFNCPNAGSTSASQTYDTIKVLLVATLSTQPGCDLNVLTDFTGLSGYAESSATGYTAGGYSLSGPTNIYVTQGTSGGGSTTPAACYLNAANITWTVTSGTLSALGCILYSTTAVVANSNKTGTTGSGSTLAAETSPLICYFDFNGTKSATSGTFVINWSTSPAAIISLT